MLVGPVCGRTRRPGRRALNLTCHLAAAGMPVEATRAQVAGAAAQPAPVHVPFSKRITCCHPDESDGEEEEQFSRKGRRNKKPEMINYF